MLAPGLATMLVVITTDAVVDKALLHDQLADACRQSFERVDSDGCMSTNDTVLLLSSGASGVAPPAADFGRALTGVCTDLAMQLLADAEGSAHDIAITVGGAASEDEAVEVGRSIARSNLFKCAVFGRDPNWGRVLAAIGTTAASFEPDRLDVSFNGVQVCRAGAIGEPRELVDLSAPRSARRGRSACRLGERDGLDQRPDLRLRQGERGVLDMSPTDLSALPLSLVQKASILTEALPWMETYAGKTVVIKYGGNAMIDERLKRAFAQDIVFMKRCGVHPVVVHGGGPQISRMLERLGIPSEFRGGLRVTTPEAMEVVRMVLVGQVGRELVGLINSHSTLAVGLSGEDGGLFTAARRGTVIDGEEVDLGLVGDVISVRTEAVEGLISSGSVPVVATIAPDVSGIVHNVNADTAAAALAVALKAERLVVLTDVEGLYRDWPSDTEIINELSASQLRELMPTLESGMLPKMEACLRAVEGGLTRATVTDGRVPHALLLEIFTNAGIGTMVTQDGLVRLGSRVFSRDQGIPPHEYANGDFGPTPPGQPIGQPTLPVAQAAAGAPSGAEQP